MATQLANAQAVLDALADSVGRTLTAQQKLGIVEEFINDMGGPGTNEQKAEAFNYQLVVMIRKIGRAHVEYAALADVRSTVDAAVSGSASGNLDSGVAPAPLPKAEPPAPAEIAEEAQPQPVKKKGWWARLWAWFVKWDKP